VVIVIRIRPSDEINKIIYFENIQTFWLEVKYTYILNR
jgi:hypothetical protein